MKFSPRPTAWLAPALVAMLAVGPAVAQDEPARPVIAPEIYQVTTPFTPPQQQTVESYIDFYLRIISEGSDKQVVDARAELVAPLVKGGTAEFNNQYSALLSPRLAAARLIESQRHPHPPDNPDAAEQRGGVIVRLNTMIVVSHLNKDEHVVALILKGIEDENPAVRYWAVRAVRTQVATLAPNQRQQLVAALRALVNVEQTDEVLRQVLLTLIDLDAVDAVVAAINDLIKLHIGEPWLTYDAKREAMRALLRRLTEMNAQNLPVQPQFLQLSRAACRYMILITQQAQGANLDEQTTNDHIEMVRLCDEVLRQIHKQLGSTVAMPQRIDPELARKNWPALQVTAQQWRDILKQQPFNFTEVDLSPAGR